MLSGNLDITDDHMMPYQCKPSDKTGVQMYMRCDTGDASFGACKTEAMNIMSSDCGLCLSVQIHDTVNKTLAWKTCGHEVRPA